MVVLLSVSFFSNAVETLDVLVVYEKNTISGYTDLNNSDKRLKHAGDVIKKLNATFINSKLGNYIQFRLVKQADFQFANDIKPGVKENIRQLRSRYFTYFNTSMSTRKPVGTLYILQKAYKADLVVAITYEGNNSSTICGSAIDMPKKSDIKTTDSKLVQSGPYGLIFISAAAKCFNQDNLYAHEFGHTAGLNHNYKEILDEYCADNSIEMLVDGASGYQNPGNFSKFSTAMIAEKDVGSTKKENRFSDMNASGCGMYFMSTCGDTQHNAVATLKKFASDYNKRGNWYDLNWFLTKIKPIMGFI